MCVYIYIIPFYQKKYLYYSICFFLLDIIPYNLYTFIHAYLFFFFFFGLEKYILIYLVLNYSIFFCQ